MVRKVSLVSLAVNRQRRWVTMAWSICLGFSWFRRRRSGLDNDPPASAVARGNEWGPN
jgi:hypothetical protein